MLTHFILPPALPPHLPQVMPLLSKIIFFDLPLVSCLSAPQHVSWKGEGRDQDEIRVLFPKFHKNIPHQISSLKRKTQKQPLETGFSALKRPCYKVFSVTYFPASKSDFIQGRKATSVFMMGRMFFCFKYQGQNSSLCSHWRSRRAGYQRRLLLHGSEKILFFFSLSTAIRDPQSDKSVSARLRCSTSKLSILAASSTDSVMLITYVQ